MTKLALFFMGVLIGAFVMSVILIGKLGKD